MSSKAQLVFTKLTNSFKVDVVNLESLDVSQIQELELFVKKRNGIFDFNAYSFEIHKNIEFYEFEKLIKSVGIKCICKENIRYTESASRIAFGQYKGMFFSDLDDSYLLWLKSNYRGEQKELIDTEVLSRRL